MAAYIIVGVDVTNPEDYATYTREVPATLAPYGGRFIVRGGSYDVLEGDFTAPRIVVLEFPDLDRAKAWHESPAYQSILPIRHEHAQTHFMVAVDGVPQATAG
jgi:uncharacterized protein (DUF1330 family)